MMCRELRSLRSLEAQVFRCLQWVYNESTSPLHITSHHFTSLRITSHLLGWTSLNRAPRRMSQWGWPSHVQKGHEKRTLCRWSFGAQNIQRGVWFGMMDGIWILWFWYNGCCEWIPTWHKERNLCYLLNRPQKTTQNDHSSRRRLRAEAGASILQGNRLVIYLWPLMLDVKGTHRPEPWEAKKHSNTNPEWRFPEWRLLKQWTKKV